MNVKLPAYKAGLAGHVPVKIQCFDKLTMIYISVRLGIILSPRLELGPQVCRRITFGLWI
jgi:hypothetical protein